jgi:aryl-alcohol dehydrogenase-like predicted oxidoreductase
MSLGSEAAGGVRSILEQRPGPVGALSTGPIRRQTGVISTATVPRRTIGLSDLSVFPLAISGNVFGWTTDDATTNRILDAYSSHGGNFIDTADSYAAGRSETMIGNWMRARRNRSAMTVATKVGKNEDNPGLRARVLTRAVNDSLVRLGTDYIDLLYLHIDDESVPFEETLLAVDELIRAGKVRYFGASDHTGNRLIEARIASAQLGVAQMVALQNQYSLMHRAEYEGDLARVAAQQQLGVMPRFALASGFLSGKYRRRSDFAQHARGAEARRHRTRRGMRVLACLDSIAAVQETSVASVALAWLLTKPRIVAPVVSASRPEQVAELANAPHLILTRQQVTSLDRASA